MGLLEDCKIYFESDDLYGVLGISRNAPEAELKKAYRKVSLLCHPDRVSEQDKEKATKKFQTLSKVHCILSDQEKRTVYDETGCFDDEATELGDKDWNDYWRCLFPKLTEKDIENFMKKYKGSQEECDDLKKCYLQFEGDMNKIAETFIGYNVNEEGKYREILMDLINKKEIPHFSKFTKERETKKNARIKKFKKEAEEVEKLKEEQESSLMQAIMHRSAARENQFNTMIENMEKKYCKNTTKKRKK